MMESSIGELNLRIRTDQDDGALVRREGEDAVRTVMERCAALMEARSPGRIALIRRLPLRWRLDEAALQDSDTVEQLARATLDAIERMAAPARLERLEAAEPSKIAVVFDDETHLFAAHLLASARGHPEWFAAAMAPEDAEEPLAALAAPARRPVAVGALTALARANVLAEALSAQPPAAVAVLAAALGVARARPPAGPIGPDGAASRQFVEAVPRTAEAIRQVDQLARIVAGWAPLSEPARALALQAHAAALLCVALDAPSARDLAAAAPAQGPAPAKASDTPDMPRTAAADEREATIAAPERDAAQSAERVDEADTSPGTLISTRCAGLFFLLALAHELELMEAVWQACLPEGEVLAAALAALVGPQLADDPAPALCGGVDRVVQTLAPTAEQFAEIAPAVAASLAQALPRRGLAELPAVRLSLRDDPAGRLLVAAAEGLPFALFAWPASTREDLDIGLSAFLHAWPQSGALSAPQALAALDRSGRIRPDGDVRSGGLHIPSAESAHAAALLALAAGGPCTLLASRAGADGFDDADAFVRRFLLRPAQVRLQGDEMLVLFPEGSADLDLRRGGLDRDPGWLPWLERDVRFVFDEPLAPQSP